MTENAFKDFIDNDLTTLDTLEFPDEETLVLRAQGQYFMRLAREAASLSGNASDIVKRNKALKLIEEGQITTMVTPHENLDSNQPKIQVMTHHSMDKNEEHLVGLRIMIMPKWLSINFNEEHASLLALTDSVLIIAHDAYVHYSREGRFKPANT